ncbi:hypothetical protein MJ634_002920 [Providencia rettgeri]|uniref:hypothetical protein n=1 Tax=Providencia rettgeri TaxID=587 RepID=UPI001B35EDD3|nr:hypothetical protein [Providencia rettgeri]ELR5089793.1 hypothetical protein [Providencia rettgeri]MBQ0605480.1 hypothetical protein [Providencia rettgeri]MCJ2222009.1 hypothetical protein [Providencia rettgeri]MDI7242378.1 hypothetical protein [Providencia rettgeri]MDY0819470.1 hypothetical protein [Providencia rettgeri]
MDKSMKNKKLLVISATIAFMICNAVVIAKYDMGFRGEQLYGVYPIGMVAYLFLIFVIFIVSGGDW